MTDPRDHDEQWAKSHWSIPAPIVWAAGIAGALVTIGGAWKTFDLPVPASRAWVFETLRPYQDDSIELLQLRRIVALNELFLWESNAVMNSNIRLNIERLKSEIAAIDRQIAARTTR